MRFEFETAATGGLRVIPEIPEPAVCLLEGYNGIGKTMSIRLLELCTGGQPYADPRAAMAWDTLRTDLGTAKIVATGLRGAERIEWMLDSTLWPAKPEEANESWLGSIHIDGRRAGMDDVKELLEVRRIAGDVTLVETLAQQVDRYALMVESLRGKMLDPQGTTHRALDLLALVEATARRTDSASLRAAEEAAAATREAAQEAAEALRREGERLALLQEADQTRQLFQEMCAMAPELDSQIVALEFDLELAEDLREKLNADLRRAESEHATSEELGRQLKNAVRTSERNRLRLAAVQDQLAECLAAAHLPEVPADVTEEIRNQHRQIDAVLRQRSELDATPLVRDLLTDLMGRLQAAEDAGLGQQAVLMDDLGGRTLSVNDLYAGLASTAASLPDSAADSQATQALDHDLKRQTARLTALRELMELLPEADRFKRLVSQAESRIKELTSASHLDSSHLDLLQEELRAADAAVVELATRRVLLRRQKDDLMGGNDPETLEPRMQALLTQSGTNLETLGAALAESDRITRELGKVLNEARVAESSEADRLAAARVDLRRAVSLLLDSDEFAYLRRKGVPLPRVGDNEDAQSEHLAELLSRAAAAQESLQDVPNRLLSIHSALGAIAGTLRGRTLSGELFVPQLRQWLEAQFGEWFRQETVRRALIPDAVSISVDLGRQALVWEDPEGNGGARPFDAFSSGEQAFAYTRAQLEALPQSSVANRLIALDEFGAFVAQNRRADLRRLLEQRSAIHPEEKTVMILPVTQDYEELSRTTRGEVAAKHMRRAEALASVEYFAESFSESFS